MLRITALAFLLVVVAAELAPLLHTENEDVIPGSYIVILKDNVGAAERDIQIAALRDRINATNAEDSDIGFSYHIAGTSFIGFSARLNKQLLGEQLEHPNVKFIEADQMMSINYKQNRKPAATATQSGATWGLARTSAGRSWPTSAPYPTSGNYVYNTDAGAASTVWVIDTGILTTHTDFGGRAQATYNAITNEANTDLNGHGTHCAGTVGGRTYGVAKSCQLKAVKVLSASGSGSNAGVIAGINYVANNAGSSRHVASMSLGGDYSSATNNAVAAAVAKNIFFAVAAGNSNDDACSYSPASEPSACTVGATTNTDARSSFSNYGPCTDIFAPGSSITSDWIGSNTATNTISGTSMACPHVAGVAALVLDYNPMSPAALNTWLQQNGLAGEVSNPGAGSDNYLLYSNPQ